MKTKKELKQTGDYFDVLDVLGGDITGDYQSQLVTMNKMGITCSESVYYEAYQCSEQV